MAVSVEGLASAIKGRVVEAGAPDYDEARALYNGMLDKRPAAIAYCADEADVAAALRYGLEHGLRIPVRGGGHNGGGLGSGDDAPLLTLSPVNPTSGPSPRIGPRPSSIGYMSPPVSRRRSTIQPQGAERAWSEARAKRPLAM